MITAAVILTLLAVAAAILGFGEFATGFAGVAKIAFVVFITLALFPIFMGARRA